MIDWRAIFLCHHRWGEFSRRQEESDFDRSFVVCCDKLPTRITSRFVYQVGGTISKRKAGKISRENSLRVVLSAAVNIPENGNEHTKQGNLCGNLINSIREKGGLKNKSV